MATPMTLMAVVTTAPSWMDLLVRCLSRGRVNVGLHVVMAIP